MTRRLWIRTPREQLLLELIEAFDARQAQPGTFLDEVEVLRVQALDLQVRERAQVGCVKREAGAVDSGMQFSLHRSQIGNLAVR